MKRKVTVSILTALTLGLLVVFPAVVDAQSGGTYDLTWSTIDGGGAQDLSGGSFTLSGTIGQPDVRWMLEGGGYTLGGGFWGSGARQYKVYLPVVLRN